MAVRAGPDPGRALALESPFVFPVALGVLAAAAVPALLFAAQRPTTAFIALGAGAVVVACALRVDVALLLLVATAPLEGAFQLSENPQLSLAKLAGALTFSSFVLFALATRRRLLVDRSHALILFILAAAMVSTLQATDVPAGVSTTLRYASYVGLYFVVSQFVGDHALQRRIAWTLSAASAVTGLLAIDNFVSGETYQASVPYTNANDTAFILATTLPLTFWLLRERGLRRFAAVAMVAAISAAIVLSFSRGAVVGLAAVALWLLVTERRHLVLVPLGVALAVVATFLFIRANPGRVEAGFAQKQQIAAYNVSTRLESWEAAAELTADDPLFGAGPGNFREHFYELTGRPPGTDNPLVVHNAYLDVTAEVGLPAGLAFLGYVILIFTRAVRAKRQRAGPPGFAAAVHAGLLVAMVSSLFLSEQYFAPLWLLGGLATALWRERHADARAP